jgi:hypothetical protein
MQTGCSDLGSSHSCAERIHGSGPDRLENHKKDQSIYCKYCLGLITWAATLEHILAGRGRGLINVGGHRQLFEAGATCWQANETLRNRGRQV